MKAVLIFLFPILEFYLLVRVGTEIGALNVVLWCIASALLGAWVLKDHGLGVLRRMQLELAQGTRPQDSMLSAVLVFLAGALLILPGLITDAIGLALLLPPVRQALAAYMARRAAMQQQSGSSQVFFFSNFGGSGFSQNTSPRFPHGGGPGFSHSDTPRFGQNQEDDPRQATIIDCTPGEISRPSAEDGSADGSGDGSGDSGPEAQVFDCGSDALDSAHKKE